MAYAGSTPALGAGRPSSILGTPTKIGMDSQVLLFYKYVTIENPAELSQQVKDLATRFGLKGRVLVAEEGINGTLEGSGADTEAFAAEILKDARMSDMHIKRSAGTGRSFPKLSVKVRKQIVGTQIPHNEADPRVRTAPHLSAEELHRWYENEEDFVVVDMRNSYEIASGYFDRTIDPGMRNSRDLPAVLPKLEPLKKKKVLTVCTGGVRCESMAAYLLNKGFENVYQLDGGIHTYMEKYPGKNFKGTLYTFDGRVTMDFGGEREVVGKCIFCKSTTERYLNCYNDDCHLHFLACESCGPDDSETYCSQECKALGRYGLHK